MSQVSTSRDLDKIADRKSISDLAAAADMTISSSSYINEDGYESHMSAEELCEVREDGFMWGVILEKKRQANPGPSSIWMVQLDEIHGPVIFFFVGTIQEVRRKISSLPDLEYGDASMSER